MKKKLIPLLVLLLLSLSPPVQARAGSGGFPDLAGHWAAGAVETAVSEGLVDGYPDGTFRPDNNVSRAEALKLIAAAVTLAPQPLGEEKQGKFFSDTAGHWVETQGWLPPVWDAGWLFPSELKDRFEPDQPASRAEIAAWAARAANLDSTRLSQHTFSDITGVPPFLRDAVQAAADHGLIMGYPDGSFRPGKQVSRAEAVVIAQRLYEKTVPQLAEDTLIELNGQEQDFRPYYDRARKIKRYLPAQPVLQSLGLPYTRDPALRRVKTAPAGKAEAVLTAGKVDVDLSNGTRWRLANPLVWMDGELYVTEDFWVHLVDIVPGEENGQKKIILKPKEDYPFWPGTGENPVRVPALTWAADAALALAGAAAESVREEHYDPERLRAFMTIGAAQQFDDEDYRQLARQWGPWAGAGIKAVFRVHSRDNNRAVVILESPHQEGLLLASEWNRESREDGHTYSLLANPRAYIEEVPKQPAAGTKIDPPATLIVHHYTAPFLQAWLDGRPVRAEHGTENGKAVALIGAADLPPGSHTVVVSSLETASGPWLAARSFEVNRSP